MQFLCLSRYQTAEMVTPLGEIFISIKRSPRRAEQDNIACDGKPARGGNRIL